MSVLRLIPQKGEAIVVDADEALVGREANCNVLVPHPSVSRRHALIKRRQEVFFVVDQGSANGTFVDSKRIVDATLKDGNSLRFGSSSFKVEIHEDLPVESIAEDDLEVAPTLMGQPAYSATLLEGDAISDEIASPAPSQGQSQGYAKDQGPDAWPPPPPVRSEVQSSFPGPQRSAEPSPPRQKAESAPPPIPAAPVVPNPAPAPTAAPAAPVATNRSPAFWLMIAAAAVALLFAGAAVGLGVAFVARRMGLF